MFDGIVVVASILVTIVFTVYLLTLLVKIYDKLFNRRKK